MSRLSEEMKVIPRAAWAIAFVGAVVIPCAVFAFIFLNAGGKMGWFPFAFLFALGAMLMGFTYILLIGYIAGDARRRGMRAILWTLLAIFIPNAIGIILYFILREPLLQHCPKCGAAAKAAFTFCSACGEALVKTCPGCSTAIQPGWSHCPQCGVSINPAGR
jgi:hypothetical protein